MYDYAYLCRLTNIHIAFQLEYHDQILWHILKGAQIIYIAVLESCNILFHGGFRAWSIYSSICRVVPEPIYFIFFNCVGVRISSHFRFGTYLISNHLFRGTNHHRSYSIEELIIVK